MLFVQWSVLLGAGVWILIRRILCAHTLILQNLDCCVPFLQKVYLILNFGFFLLVRQFLDAGGMLRGDLAPADLKAALGNGAALRWLVGAALLVGASEFARAFAFHFAEPLVFLWGIPVSTALRLSAGAALRQPVRFAAFFTIVIASRAAYLAIAVFAALMLPPAAMLPAAVIILLPFDFLIRVFGTRFIAPRLPDDADSGN